MRNRFLLIIAIIMATGSAKAQTKALFDDFAQDFFILLSDTSTIPPLEYIRIKTWKQLIEEQDLSSLEQQDWIIRKNKEYPQEEAAFRQKLGSLIESYHKALSNGASLEFLNADFQDDKRWKNWYHCQLRFILQTEELQTIVQLNYQLYYNGKGLMFIGTELEELF